MVEKLTAGMESTKIEFLEQLASKPDQVMEVLKNCGISARRLANWLSDAEFRGCYMVRCAHYEEMQFPGFVASMRAKAMGSGKDAPKFAAIYIDMLKGRSEHMLKGAYPDGDGVPEEPEKPKESEAGQKPLDLKRYGNLGQDDIADLISPAESGVTS